MMFLRSADMEAAQVSITTRCILKCDGKVMCVPTLKFNTQCETDYAYWPYDAHVCSIRMGSWTHTGEQISFDLDGDYVGQTRNSQILRQLGFYSWFCIIAGRYARSRGTQRMADCQCHHEKAQSQIRMLSERHFSHDNNRVWDKKALPNASCCLRYSRCW